MSKTTNDNIKVSPTPLLPTIDSPEQLRALPTEVLPQVCAELRQFLIDNLSSNPGHFASSMGAVEIAVALHYVFDTPYDRIVWDVGHQAYAHKILTGRREAFANNRKFHGISGFPNPEESPYDTFTAGHASNSISAALGMAVAAQLKQDQPRRNVVAVIGDASISGGLAFEGINNAANTPNNLLIVLNDNDMAIDPNVGSLNSYLANLTTTPWYNNVRYKLYKLFRKMGLISDHRRGAMLRFNNSLKALLTHQQNIFEGLNIRYFGPFDGNDVSTVVRVLRDIRNMDGPRILHLRTVKGKGFPAAEADPATWHAPGKFDPVTGERATSTQSKPKYQDIFGEMLVNQAKADPRIVAITAAMPSGTSVSRMQHEMPDRTFDVGISEGHAVTFAGGLAKDGLRPVVAIYSSFLQRGYDQIIHDAAIQNLPVTLCIDRAGLVGEDGPTHHGAFDMAYLRTVPNITIAAPSDGTMLRDLMHTAAMRTDGVFAIRYPRGAAENAPTPGSEPKVLPVGKGIKLRDGRDATILTIGPTKDEAIKAAEMLANEGKEVAIYDMIYVKPLDTNIINQVAKLGAPVITVEDASREGGFGSAVAENLAEIGFGNTVTRLGIPDRFIKQGTPAQLRQLCGFDAESIAEAVRKAVEEDKRKEVRV